MNAGNLIGIFIHPARTARALDEKPTWLLAVIVCLAVTALIGWMVFGISRVESIERMKEGRMAKFMPADAIQKMEEDAQNITTRQRIFGGVVMPVAMGLLLQILAYGAILHGIARAMGGQGSFSRTWALVAHCRLINPAAAGLVALPIILAKQSVFTVSLSLAALFPSLGPGSFIYGLLSIFSVFGIWFLVSIASGLEVIHKLPRNLAWVTAGIPWLAAGLFQAVQIAFF
jgi:hypothetical protein